MQTKRQSFTESLTNTAVGFFLSVAAGYVVYPLYGVDTFGFAQYSQITAIFTVISIARGYGVRRVFNYIYHRGN